MLLLAVVFLVISGAYAESADNNTLAGKLIMGYQGWFTCPSDKISIGWGHWKLRGKPAIDLLPDLSELPKNDQCLTQMKDSSGHPISLFSSQNPQVVQKHFEWMRHYDIDGVALQRFGRSLVKERERAVSNVVLTNVKKASENTNRLFFIMYDLSGLPNADLPLIIEDWKELEHQGITSSSAYIHHHGHPLLGIWGLGFAGRNLKPNDAKRLLEGLKKVSEGHGGITFLGGLPSYWRTGKKDASDDRGWKEIWPMLGIISPWSVGRFTDISGADTYQRVIIAPDIKATSAMGIDYLPVIFPGYSFANAQRSAGHPDKAIFNSIPRRCGNFLWRQVFNARGSGANMLYGAMFDEVNEGTALFKVINRKSELPFSGVPKGYSFISLDADGCNLPSDWYLRLGGEAAKLLHKHANVPKTIPFSPN